MGREGTALTESDDEANPERVTAQGEYGHTGPGPRRGLAGGDNLTGGHEITGGEVVTVDEPGIDARGGEDTTEPVSVTVDTGVLHPLLVGQLGEADLSAPAGRGMGGGHGDELGLPAYEYAEFDPVGDPQGRPLDLVDVGGVELPRGDHTQQRMGGDVRLEGDVGVGEPHVQPP